MLLRSLSSLPIRSNLVQLRYFSELSKAQARKKTRKKGPKTGPYGLTDYQKKIYRDEFFEIVKKYAPVTFPQICSCVQASTVVFASRSKQWIKNALLRPLIKKQRIRRLGNPIIGCDNVLFHVGKRLEPENPDLCPNTEGLKRKVASKKSTKRF